MTTQEAQTPRVSVEMKTVLEVIASAVWKDEFWPKFWSIDRPLLRQEINAQSVLNDLVPLYVLRDGSGVAIQNEETIRLTIKGINETAVRDIVIPLFLKVLVYLVEYELSFEPTTDNMEPLFTLENLIDLLAKDRPYPQAEKLALRIGLLIIEEARNWRSGVSWFTPLRWGISLSYHIRQYQGVTTIDAYLERIPNTPNPSTTVQVFAENQSILKANLLEEEPVDPRTVFIVHGRDLEAKLAISQFLQDLDLRPVEWEEMVEATGLPMPYTGNVVSLAFRSVRAVVVLLTPDDLAYLHEDLQEPNDAEWEKLPTGQARPNVLFETGMALAIHPDRTIIVEMGTIRPFSDVAGRNTIRFSPAAGTLNALATRLATAGCAVNTSGANWLDTSRFENLRALERRAPLPIHPPNNQSELPLGVVLPSTPTAAEPRLTAKLMPRGKDYLLEITNRGGVALSEISFELDPNAGNWLIMRNVLPRYPIALLEPRSHIRIPVVLAMGSAAITTITLIAKTENGGDYSSQASLSIYD